ncbi:hypothetical protein F4804DRAFT_350256 [Jackrogersella minutella]|nr:hypothetical protein F4804DRAFT_350256 [Jackrogersella minutella]
MTGYWNLSDDLGDEEGIDVDMIDAPVDGAGGLIADLQYQMPIESDTLRLSLCKGELHVRLLGTEPGLNKVEDLSPIGSKNEVVVAMCSSFGSSGGYFAAGTLVLIAIPENLEITLRALGYLLAKKNTLYHRARAEYGNSAITSTEPHRFEWACEKKDYINKTAAAMTLNPSRQYLQLERVNYLGYAGCNQSVYGVLLLARHDQHGVLQYYNPMTGITQYQAGAHDTVFMECEGAMITLWSWAKSLEVGCGVKIRNAFQVQSMRRGIKRAGSPLDERHTKAIYPQVATKDGMVV